MSAEQVRVRFAPSPTGYLHVGGARTALFNWLLARKHGGQLVLRIEDTDQKREVGDSLPKILDDLRWLGLDWDEGPESGGGATGDFGPYFQSKRLELYDKYCQQLLDSGDAYYAFDTPEELAAMREEAKRNKQTFKYPRPHTFATADDAERARADGKPAVVRFKIPDHDITVTDSILGEVTLSKDDLEDFVIRKADGFPTYHFACVVDDELMKITHVLRGSEHLNNTPKHIAIQQALGFHAPVYAHMPIIMNMSGSKMSKRDKEKAVAKGEPPPEIDVHDFRAAGFLPEALVNFIALLGWSPGDDREDFALDELVEAFTLERIGKTSAKFDRDKLLSFNTDWCAKLPPDRLLAAFRDFLQLRSAHCGLRNEEKQSRDRQGAVPESRTPNHEPPALSRGLQAADPDSRPTLPPGLATADDATLARVLEVCKGFRTFADVLTKAGFIFMDDDAIEYDPKAVRKVLEKNDGEGYAMLARILPVLEELPAWTAEGLEALLKTKLEEWSVGFGKLAQPIRVAVSGTTVSPQIIDTLILLGRERTIARIKNCSTHA